MMNKKIIGIMVCLLFFGASVTTVISGNVEKKNMVEKGNFLNTPPEEEWNVTFGGIYGDGAKCVQQTLDGGYVIGANTKSSETGPTNAWVIKTNKTGYEGILDNSTWNTTIGGNYYYNCLFVNQTANGDYIITGKKSIQGLHSNFWICRINNIGEYMWDKSFGDTWSETGYCGRETSDGNLIFTGKDRGPGYDNDLWLIKTDSNGNMLWDKIWGTGSGTEDGRSVMETFDNGYIVVGIAKNEYTTETDKYDIWLIKTNINGVIEWDRYLGEMGNDVGFCVQQTKDNGYILCGKKEDNYGFNDILLLKTNNTGMLMWNKTFGGVGDDIGWCVKQTNDGGFIIVGDTNSSGAGDYDIWLIKIDETGFMEWNMTIGGEKPDKGRSISVTNDGGYIIAGFTNSSGYGSNDVWLIKIAPDVIPQPDLDCSGELIWNQSKPISNKVGSFTVENIGDTGSLLDWEIVEYPDWGEWTFTPMNGDDLRPEDGKVKVNVSLVPPKNAAFHFEEESNRGFTGEVKIVNKENSSDYCTIKVYLRTQKNKEINNPLLNWLQSHPNWFPLLQKLLQNFGL